MLKGEHTRIMRNRNPVILAVFLIELDLSPSVIFFLLLDRFEAGGTVRSYYGREEV
jgi:hypothetical protein